MKEAVIENRKLVEEVMSDKRKYTIDANGYRRYEGTCTEPKCGKDYVRSIPDYWFNKKNEITEHNLPGDVSLEAAQRAYDSTICGACEPENKAKLKRISELKENNK